MSKHKQKKKLPLNMQKPCSRTGLDGGRPVMCNPNTLDFFDQNDYSLEKNNNAEKPNVKESEKESSWRPPFNPDPWQKLKGSILSRDPSSIQMLLKSCKQTNQPTNKLKRDNKLKFWKKNVDLMMVLKGRGIAVIITVQPGEDMNVCTKSGSRPAVETYH